MDFKLNIEFLDEIYTIAVLVTFGIYHMLIYLGRKWYKVEKYYYYLSFIAFSISLYVFIQLYSDGFPQLLPKWFNRSPFEVLFGSAGFYGFVKFSSHVYSFPRTKESFFRISYLSLFTCLLATIYSFIDYAKFLQYLFIPIVLVFSISIVGSTYVFTKWILSQKLYKDIIFIIISMGISLMMLNVLVIKAIIAFGLPIQFSKNYFFVDVGIILITYALALKFNQEHKELKELKETLEIKVNTRTFELDMANREIAEVSRQKTMSFINIAHETKTPLTLISNFFDRYISKNGETEELSIVKRNICGLKKIMINFLDAEKLERGQIFYNHDQIVNFSELLNEKYILFDQIAEKKNIDFSYNISKNLSIKADPFAIDRIINNLIDNAFKYTNINGKIWVTLESENNKIIFTIKDNGIGISDEKLQNIFHPYYQISHKKQNVDGIGMGLYIVKKIIDDLQGEISVKSEIDKGTEFILKFMREDFIYFDAIIADRPNLNETNEILINYAGLPAMKNTTETRLEHQCILLVEDNIDLVYYIKSELNEYYNIYTALNGYEALRELKFNAKPDLIISDIMMDKMDGYEFYNTISTIEAFNSIPFIFLTAKTSTTEKIEMLNKGAIAYLHKPFSINELKAKIRSILENARKQQLIGLQEAINLISKQLNGDVPKKEGYKSIKWESFDTNCEKFKITERQKEIIRYVSEGLEYKEIANTLHISTRTVTRHIQNIFENLDIHNKVDLINKLFN